MRKGNRCCDLGSRGVVAVSNLVPRGRVGEGFLEEVSFRETF